MPVGLIFKQEPMSRGLFEEMHPLAILHNAEVSPFKETIDPDFDIYESMQTGGVLKVFTARSENGTLEGYAVFIVCMSPHYKTSLHAMCDLIYIRPDKRGPGYSFIVWAENELKKMGVKILYIDVPVSHNFGKMLERRGHRLIEYRYALEL